jgi:hypothetical protein
MEAVSLYACWDGEHWVIMLPSEYWYSVTLAWLRLEAEHKKVAASNELP